MIKGGKTIAFHCDPDVLHVFLSGDKARTYFSLLDHKVRKVIADPDLLPSCLPELLIQLIEPAVSCDGKGSLPFDFHFLPGEPQNSSIDPVLLYLYFAQPSFPKG